MPPSGPDVITKKQYAAEWLREMIVSGDLEPGRRVRQQEVADRLGISATPVREAILQLETEGYLDSIAHVGVRVAELADDHRDEVMELRKLLEGQLALSAAQRITDAQIEQLNQLHTAVRRSRRVVPTPARLDGSTTSCTGSSGTSPVATSPDRSFKDSGRGCRGAAWTMSLCVVANRCSSTRSWWQRSAIVTPRRAIAPRSCTSPARTPICSEVARRDRSAGPACSNDAALQEALMATRFDHWIGGRSVRPSGGDYLDSMNPVTARPWAAVARGTSADVDDAVSAAAAAFGRWRRTTPSARSELLWRLADLIADSADELAILEARDIGKVVREMRAQMTGLVRWYRYYATLAHHLDGRVIPLDRPSTLNYTLREPYGVIAVIAPFNSPVLLASMSIGPALAAGNTVVVKPSEIASPSLVRFARLFDEAGFPSGVVNVVTGLGHEVGDALASHRRSRQGRVHRRSRHWAAGSRSSGPRPQTDRARTGWQVGQHRLPRRQGPRLDGQRGDRGDLRRCRADLRRRVEVARP